jgi:hypothetical protein
MIVTSAAIPPVAVYWWLRGALEFRSVGRMRTRGNPEPAKI